MLITIFTILISSFLFFFASSAPGLNAFYLTVIILVSSTSIFLGTILLYTFVLIPLGYLRQTLIPNLMDIVQQDRFLRISSSFLFFIFSTLLSLRSTYSKISRY